MARKTLQNLRRRGRNQNQRSINAIAEKIEDAENISFPSFAVADLPAAASYEGRLVYCSNGATGSPCLAYSNGTDWLRITLGAAVAAA